MSSYRQQLRLPGNPKPKAKCTRREGTRRRWGGTCDTEILVDLGRRHQDQEAVQDVVSGKREAAGAGHKRSAGQGPMTLFEMLRV
jgi:hypothetical protein